MPRSPRHSGVALQRSAIACIVFLLALLAVQMAAKVGSLGDGLSLAGDAWTEADVLRSGEGYARLGFRENQGLPDLCYGNQFADQGTKQALRKNFAEHEAWRNGALAGRPEAQRASDERFVYTHYPPGPHWIAGVATVLWGTSHVNLYRVLPISAGLLGLAYLAWAVARRLGAWSAVLTLSVICALPMVVNAMHSLVYQGYAFALLLLELGICLRLTERGARQNSLLAQLVLLGFLQGWFGFDYLFLISLAPLSVWLVVRGELGGWQTPVRAGWAAAAGFALAHVLHFAQVALYFQSVATAMVDLTSVAQYRSAGGTSDTGVRLPSGTRLLWKYLTDYTGFPTEFGMPIIAIAALGVTLAAALRLWREQPLRSLGLRASGVLVALLASSMWVIVMPQHSAQHWHILPRHYFLTALISVLVVVCELAALLRERQPAASPALHAETRTGG